MKNIDWQAYQELLLTSILENVSPGELFSRVYDLLHLPLLYFDVSFRLIACAFPRPFYYPHWENIAANGGASPETVDDYNYLSSQEEINASDTSVLRNSGTSEGFPQACGAVRIDGNLIGYCGVMQEDASIADALRINDLLIRALRTLAQNAARQAADVKSGDVTLTERLLSGDTVSPDLLASFSSRYAPPYLFAIVRSRAFGQSTLRYLQHLWESRFPVLVFLSGSDTLCALLHGVSYAADPASVLPFDDVIQKYGASCGISDFFDRIDRISDANIQAVLSTVTLERIHPEKQTAASFRSLYPYVLADRAIDRLGARACRSPLLERLARNAGEEADVLMDTLSVYLAERQRTAQTARTLHIHKNTVGYRIRKMERLLDAPLSNPLLCARLEAGLLVRHLSELHEKGEREHGGKA